MIATLYFNIHVKSPRYSFKFNKILCGTLLSIYYLLKQICKYIQKVKTYKINMEKYTMYPIGVTICNCHYSFIYKPKCKFSCQFSFAFQYRLPIEIKNFIFNVPILTKFTDYECKCYKLYLIASC